MLDTLCGTGEVLIEQPLSEPEEDATLNIKIKDRQGELLKLKLKPDTSVAQILQKIALLRNVSLESLRLKFDGDTLEMQEILANLDLEDGDTLDLVT